MEKKSKEDLATHNLESEEVNSNLEANVEEMENDKEINVEDVLEKYNSKDS